MRKILFLSTTLTLLVGCSTLDAPSSSPTAGLATSSRSVSRTGSGDAVGEQLFSPTAIAQRQQDKQARDGTARID